MRALIEVAFQEKCSNTMVIQSLFDVIVDSGVFIVKRRKKTILLKNRPIELYEFGYKIHIAQTKR